jgi:hypothetical protein
LVQARGYFERALTVDPGKLDALLGVGWVDYSVQLPPCERSSRRHDEWSKIDPKQPSRRRLLDVELLWDGLVANSR